MADESAEKTEDPTARHLSKAREDGQIARSQDLTIAAVTIAAMGLIYFAGDLWMRKIALLFGNGFRFDRKTLETPSLLPALFADFIFSLFWVIVPLLVLTVITAIFASGATGGYNFSMKAARPKLSKISPINGFKRMFGINSLVELVKSILKCSLVTLVLYILFNRHFEELVMLGSMGIHPGLALSGNLLAEAGLWLAASLGLIAMIDVPYQKHAHMKKMLMTKQQVRDEMKDSEGRPEVKQQIRRRQQEVANNKMIQKVKDADVIITNPEHFAVALSYDPTSSEAPILLAKGADHMAALIREEGKKNNVEIFEAAPLARALYFTTELNNPIPESLYYAVAQVIAYVFSLGQVQPGIQPMQSPKPKIPVFMQFDSNVHFTTPGSA